MSRRAPGSGSEPEARDPNGASSAGSQSAAAGAKTKTRVLVVGGGFAGLYASIYLTQGDLDTEALEVVLVSERNYFTFTPLLHDVVGGTLSEEHVSVPYRVMAARRGFRFLQARVQGVDAEARRVQTSSGSLGYDYLVLALGAGPRGAVDGELGGREREAPVEYTVPGSAAPSGSAAGGTATAPPPGARRGDPSAETGTDAARPRVLEFHTVAEARALHDRVIRLAEVASRADDPERKQTLLTFVFVGGGPAGVEAAGEVDHLLTEILPPYYEGMGEARVVLVHAGARLLEGWEPELVEEGQEVLRRRGVELRLRTRLTDFDLRTRIGTLRSPAGEERLEATTVVRTTGTRPRTGFLEGSDLPLDRRGHVDVDRYLQVRGHPAVFAAGDATSLVNPRTGEPYPSVAPIAVSQGIRAAANLLSVIHGYPFEPYVAHHAGKIVSLGGGASLVEVLRWTLRGRPAWLVDRAAYLLKLVGARNKLQAAVALLAGTLFERDLRVG